MKRKCILHLSMFLSSIMMFSCNYSYEIPDIRNTPADIKIISFDYIEYPLSEDRIDIFSSITNAERIPVREKGVCYSLNNNTQPTVDSNTIINSYTNENDPYLFSRSIFVDSTVNYIIIRSYFKSDSDIWYSKPIYINTTNE